MIVAETPTPLPFETNADPSDYSALRPAFEAGEVVDDRFRIVGQIHGEQMGAQSSVFRAESEGGLVALKAFHVHDARDLVRAAREVMAQESVAGAGALPVVRHGLIGGSKAHPYMTTPYMSHGNLSVQDIHRQENPITMAEMLARGLLSPVRTVRAMHKKGLVHRDFKPDNVVVDEDDIGRLTDFGIVGKSGESDAATKIRETFGNVHIFDQRLTGKGVVAGTPGYIDNAALTRDQLAASSTNDTYGVGVTIFRLVTGRLPQWETAVQTIARGSGTHSNVPRGPAYEPVDPRVFNRTVPREVAILAIRCLSDDIEFRPPDEEIENKLMELVA